ncbi:MAG: MFS transporter [Bacilli bacterium]|nr:MFS transporter [Bacilli bacterium]
MSEKKQKKSFFETPLMSSKIKSSNVSLFPEAGLGYLLGPLLALICNGVVNIWLIQYWDKVLGLGEWNPLFETLLPIISAILIVAGNIMVGRLMERKPSIAGKARPLILLGMPAVAIALLLLFLVPFPKVGTEGFYNSGMSFADVMFDNGGLVASIFVAVGYNLFYALAWPIYYTSHSALVNLSTRNGGSRGLLSTCIMAAQLGAAGLSGMAGGLLVDLIGLMPKYEYTIIGAAKVNAAVAGSAVAAGDSFGEFATPLIKEIDYVTVISREQANSKWTILMIVMIASLVVGCLLEYFFTRERITEEAVKNAEASAGNAEEKKEVKAVPMSKQIAVCMKDKYWWLIIIFFFLYQFGGQMKNNAMSFYSFSMTGGYSVSSLINTVGAIPTAIGMVLVWPIANKITKSKTILLGGVMAFVCGLIAYVPLFLASPSVGTISTISVISFCLKALGTAPAMYISLALLANMLDHQEAVYGIRTDGFTMAVYGSIMVAMAGVCNGLIVGLKSVIPGDGKFLMTTLAFGVEAVCYLIMAGLMIFMNVEKYTKADNLAIIADQKAKVLAEGGEWIEPEERARLEEEENARLVEEARVAQLKADCEKKGLDYDAEEAKYQEKKAAADAAAAEKKAAAEAKKQAAYDALTPEQKEAKAQKEAAAKAKADADLEVAVKELDGIREANKALRESLVA